MAGANLKRLKQVGVAVMALGAVAGCAPKPVPVPAPPPIVQIPPRPYPPMGASANLVTPQALADGTRLTVNYNLSPEQATWNLRSAYNVAALNCMKPEHAPILANYGDFLKGNKKQLADVNKALDDKFKSRFGSDFIRQRETFQTQVYNYFALPPVVPALCDTALVVGQELRAVDPSHLQAYAPIGLAKLEQAYREFFDRYDRYKADLAAWNARYGVPGQTANPTYPVQGNAQ